MKRLIENLFGEWLWVLVGLVNIVLCLVCAAGVAGWNNDVSAIAGYTFMLMLMVAGIECIFGWTHENVPAAAISGVVAGTVIVLLIFN